MKKSICLIVIVCCIAPVVQAETYRVDMFHVLVGPYWDLVLQFMQEAAKDVGLDLRLHFYDNNHLELLRQVETVVQADDKPDVIVFTNFKQMAPSVFEMAEQAQIRFFLMNSGLTPEQAAKFGGPRSFFHFWIGEMLPDDEWAAVALPQKLLDLAATLQPVSANGNMHILGINGEMTAVVAIIRKAGLERAVSERTDVNLLQIVPIRRWDSEEARERFKLLYQRYPQMNVVWTANSNLAHGVMAGMRELGLTPGQEMIIGTFDVDEQTLQHIQAGEIAVTGGGHFIEGARVIVTLYDYLHGIDFAEESLSLRTPITLITPANVERYLGKLTPENLTPANLARIDFTRYSKVLHPEGTEELTFDSVMVQF